MAAASECDLEGFLKFVLQKTEELSLSKDGGSFSENFLSELLTHVDLLGKTTQLLHEIGDSSDGDDNKRWNDLENVPYYMKFWRHVNLAILKSPYLAIL